MNSVYCASDWWVIILKSRLWSNLRCFRNQGISSKMGLYNDLSSRYHISMDEGFELAVSKIRYKLMSELLIDYMLS